MCTHWCKRNYINYYIELLYNLRQTRYFDVVTKLAKLSNEHY